MPSDLDTFVAKNHQKFTAKIGKSFSEKKRISDFRLVFIDACRKHFPGLQIPWLQKHTGITKVLLKTYSPESLTSMITHYLGDIKYRKERGISLESFWYASSLIATDMASSAKKKVVVAERQKIAEPVQPQDQELAAFTDSPFFKRLPKLFQEHVASATRQES